MNERRIYMTKKCFAAIKSAQEMSKTIHRLVKEVQADPSKMAANFDIIAGNNARFLNDFADVDPYWVSNQQKVEAEEKRRRQEYMTVDPTLDQEFNAF